MDDIGPRRYRIGFLNPWREAAENQAFFSLAIAARRIGHELVHVTNSDEIIAAGLDFVLAVDPSLPKTTDVATFGAIHSPFAVLMQTQSNLGNLSYFDSLLTYDGYLTIADSLARFLRAFCIGTGKLAGVGFYYNAPQRQYVEINIEELVAAGTLRLCYFGVNWEPRARTLYRALARRPYMRIYGPQKAWEYLNGVGYCGAVPFDGRAVQQVYAAFGAGLVSLSRQHALDDVISNRVFEISSVGAVSVCPDIPWLRKHFGDSVFYYDPFGTVAAVVGQIDRAMAAIQSDPRGAAQRARAARAVFEAKFSAEIMLQNAVAYYEAWRERAGASRDPAAGPAIDVIMPVGRRPASAVERAVRSIDKQAVGRFRVILVRAEPIELGAIIEAGWRRIEGFAVIDEPDGGRAALLRRGLAAVRAPLFAVLDDDGFWLSGHIAALLARLREAPPGCGYAYSGTIRVEEAGVDAGATARERRHLGSRAPVGGDLRQLIDGLSVNAFLASAELLHAVDLDAAIPDAVADALLQVSLISRAEPVFSYGASACVLAGPDDADATSGMTEDVLEAMVYLGASIDRVEAKLRGPAMSGWSGLKQALQQILEQKERAVSGTPTRLVLEGDTIVPSIHDRDDLERREIPLTTARVWLGGASRFAEHEGKPVLAVLAERQSWAFGATIRLDAADLYSGSHWVVVELAPLAAVIGIGLLQRSQNDFQVRMQLPVSAVPVEVWLQVHNSGDVSALVVLNWAPPAALETQIYRVWVVKETNGADQFAT